MLLGLLNEEEDGMYAQAYNEVETYVTETVRDGLPNDFLEEIGESEEEGEKVEEEGDGDDSSSSGGNSTSNSNVVDSSISSGGCGDRDLGTVGEISDETEETEEQTESITVEATAYTARCEGCSGITYSGVDVRNTIYHEGRRVIAVDPNVIPLGSVVKITVGGESFEATAEDIGSAIQGHRIDLLVETREEALQFGRKPVKAEILE